MILRPTLIVLLTLAVAGCGMFGVRDEYREARQARPLEVPPEMNLPSTQGTMVVPEVRAGGATPSSRPGVLGSERAPTVATVRVADEPDNTWRRVALALDRAGEITVLASDEAQRTVEVELVSVVEPQGGWFSRTFRRSRVERDVYVLQVRADDGAQSRVEILDASGRPASGEAARRIASVLRQRLG